MRKLIIFISMFFLLTLAGCGGEDQLTSSLKDDSQNFVEDVAQKNNQFTFELFQETSKKNENTLISPYSISSALAMTYGGAAGKTALEMQSSLHFSSDEFKTHSGYKGLNTLLNANKEDHGYRLSVANRLWGQEGYDFKLSFIDKTLRYYDAEAAAKDFKNDPEGARQDINLWVEKQTEQKIKDLIPENTLKRNTRLVLTNAIYFKGEWESKFDSAFNVTDQFFTTEEAEQVSATFMYQKNYISYFENSDLQAVVLPYSSLIQSKSTSMLILLPRQGSDLSKLETGLNSQLIGEILAQAENRPVHLFIPKFRVEDSNDLSKPLQSLGMKLAFDMDRANFTQMANFDPELNLYLDKVLHKTFIDVSEGGVEAAGATSVIVGERTSTGNPPPEFRADRPFIYLIRDNQTGTILFLGRLANPSA